MSKPRGAVCNLDCEYCFFLAKEELYPGSDFRMSRAVLEAYVGQLVAGHADATEVVLAFQGGEPTMMGLDFFATAVALARAAIRPTQRILFTIQTNGTLLDDAWGAFLAREGFLVGLSIDGPRAMHDAFRVDKGGKPTFDRVLGGLDVLRRHGVAWNVLTTANAANAPRGREVCTFLRDELGACVFQLIPIVEREGDGVSRRRVDGAAYGRFLVDVFEEWVRHDVGDVFVTMFDSARATTSSTPNTSWGTSATAARCSSSSPRRGGWRSGWTRSGSCHSSAAPAASDSPAMAVARRTGSTRPPTASPTSTTCARATWTSSRTSTGRCASWPTPCAAAARPPSCAPGASGRTRAGRRTTPAPAATGARGAAATDHGLPLRRPRTPSSRRRGKDPDRRGRPGSLTLYAGAASLDDETWSPAARSLRHPHEHGGRRPLSR
jgi:anaerobic sulfatase-maturating enzyme